MKNISKLFSRYIRFVITFLIIIIAIRFYEYIHSSMLHSLPAGSFWLSFKGLFYDLYLGLFISALLLIPYLLFGLINIRLANIIFLTLSSLILIVYLGLAHYFAVQLFPLGKDFFGYTTAEIKQTVLASGELNIISLISLIIPVLIYIFLAIYFKRLIMGTSLTVIFYILIILSVFFTPSLLTPDESNFKKDLEYYLICNKLGYFIKQNAFENTITVDKSNSTTNEANSQTSDDFIYVNKEYPLLHLDNTKDEMSAYFNKSERPPNFVFILVESLSSAFTGKKAYLGSFTPYLDSLIEHSLYWQNFLSTTGRTFGVLPSVFGSLPFGNNGFLDLAAQSPRHLTLISLLKDNGYYTGFYYGGNPHFDMMDIFLKKQKIDFISTESIYGSSYKKFPSNSGGFTWGYADKEVFRKAIELTANKTQQPRLDILMTLATHDPFLVPDQSYYNDKFHKRLKQIGLNENDENYVNDMKKYAAILYMDDAIKYLINSYSKREDFQNTIFIITGDHRMAEIPLLSKIDKYHVPLIIYSPLLKKAEKFEAVSSHLDITPTIIAFLKNNYSLKFPSKVHWLGKGIDFNKSFRNIHSLAFMWDKTSLYNYLHKDYFINQNTLFKLSKDMNIDPIKSDSIFNIVYAMLNDFKEKNQIVCFNNKLYPENIDDSKNDNVNVKENEKANEQTNTINNKNYKESEIISLKEITNNFENNYKNNKKISNRKAFSGQYSMRIEPKNNKEIILDSILIKELF
ncbi:MAG: LTA synthase family protein, partial [Bacteroidales bacterium]|nr:LTA synthase family protein [Bacteroidales bacterium]